MLYGYQHSLNRAHWVKALEPYRSSYFAIGLCLKGKATLQINLKEYTLEAGTLVFVRNADIKQWLFRSDNYEIHSILFEKDALINAVGNEVFNQDFGFFNDELYKLNLNKDQAFQLESDFLDFKKIYLQKHKMRNRKLAHFLAIILYSIAEISSGIFPPGTLSRARELTNQFIGLACKHVVNERSLDYYSDRMGISTKHLSETVKSVLDKPASAVLADLLLLEAKVRLKESTFTVEEIAFQLHFNDASAFNKFFKRHAGTTPNQYRKA